MGVIVSPNLVLPAIVSGVEVTNDNPLVGWRNIVTASSLSATSEDLSFPVTNLANPSSALYWKGIAGSNTQFLTVDFSGLSDGTDPVDYLAIAGHNFGSGQFSLQVEGATQTDSAEGFDWEPLSEEIVPGDDSPLLFRFTSNTFLQMRLVITPLNDTVAPRCAVLQIGRLTILERRIYVGHKPITFNTKANIVTGRSELGHFLGRVVLSEMSETQIELDHITPIFYRTEMEPWRQHAIEKPFFFAWRPGSYPYEVGYCWAMSDMQVQNQRSTGFMQVSLTVQGITR
jgi:hypothetical protein